MKTKGQQKFLKYIAQTSPYALLLEVSKGKGIYLWDKRGRKYIDLISGIGVNNLGHNHPAVTQSAKNQISRYSHANVYGEFVLEPQVKLAELLVKNLPSKLNCVYFVNSGAEAVEGALKLATIVTGRKEIISFRNSYHGSTTSALSAIRNNSPKQQFLPLLPGVKQIRFNDPALLEKITRSTAAVIVEPIQGEAGVILPQEFPEKGIRKNVLQLLGNRCRTVGAMMIFDEIQTGCGRTGKLFAYEHFGVVPDILCLAKALGGGFPLGAFISSHRSMKELSHPPFSHLTTFGGNPVACAAGYALFKFLIDKSVMETMDRKEKLFRSYLSHPLIKAIRGKGLMLALEFENAVTAQKVVKACYHRGMVTDFFLFAENCIRLYPSLIITEEEIRFVCKKLLAVLDCIYTSRAVNRGI